MGGTFDHLHNGHKFLVETALTVSKHIVIGLTSSNLLKNKPFVSQIEDYNTRKTNLESFIASIADSKRIEIIKLEDPYGPPINEPEYEGLVVSQETYHNALKINEIREEKGFKPLIIIVIPMIRNKFNNIISSRSIREKLDKKI